MLSKPFAVSIRVALPVLLVFALFFCPLVVFAVREEGTPGALKAVNRMLQGTGLSIGTGAIRDAPDSRVFAVRIEPAAVVTRDGVRLPVRHTFDVYDSDEWCTEPWVSGGEKGGALGSMLGIAVNPPHMPPGGLAVRCNGVLWALECTDAGPVLGPASWAATPSPLEEVWFLSVEPAGDLRLPGWSRQEKWFNDEGANRLIDTPSLTIKKGYVNKSVALEPARTGVFFTAGMAEDGSPLAGVAVVPLEDASPWTHVALVLAAEQGSPPQATLTIPHPVPGGAPPQGPCVLDLLLDENGAGGRIGLSDLERHTDWEVWWSSDGVMIVPAM